MLARMPEPKSLGAIYRLFGYPVESVTGPEMGITTRPERPAPPKWQTVKMGTKWKIQVTAPAQEGDNLSAFLADGVYETNDFFFPDRCSSSCSNHASCIGESLHPGSHDRVYLVVSPEMAQLTRGAELEHCQDIMYAYKITLNLLEVAIRNASMHYYDSAERASYAILNEIRDAFGYDANKAAEIASNPQKMVDRYLELCEKTSERDQKNWHTLFLGEYTEPKINTSAITLLTDRSREEGGRKYLAVTRGTACIGRYLSRDVIK